MRHELIIEPGFRGLDGFCETCFDPDYVEGGWTGYPGVHNESREEILNWFAEHVTEMEDS